MKLSFLISFFFAAEEISFRIFGGMFGFNEGCHEFL